MANKDKIFESFLNHEILERNYGVRKEQSQITVNDGLNSDIRIVKAIALIVNGMEKSPTATNNELSQSVLHYLNTEI
jgi:hypothetical protein